MNFFETLFEGIDLENDINVNENENENEAFDMSEEDFEQAIEVMEANKFLAQSRLDSLNVERACLEAEISGINGFFLGEGLSDIKDKALELWERFKEWVEGILSKIKVFFAKFAISRKQMAILDRQKSQISPDKLRNALSHLGLNTSNTNIAVVARQALGEITIAASFITDLTPRRVSDLKIMASDLATTADEVSVQVKTLIDEESYSGLPLTTVHGNCVKPIGSFIKGLENMLKSAQKAQRKHDRLDRGTNPNVDSESVTQVRGMINAGNKIYAILIKYFFHEVRVTKNLIAYAGKEADLSTSDKKDMKKIKGRVKF